MGVNKTDISTTILSITATLVLWEVLTVVFNVPGFILPPPSAIFMTLADKKLPSMIKKRTVSVIAAGRFQPHTWRATTYARSVVITMVPVTAMP